MKKERIIIYILCFLFLLMGFLLFFGFRDAKMCVGNPLIYGVNKMTNEDTGDIFCSCSFGNPNYAPFYFDNESIGVIGVRRGW